MVQFDWHISMITVKAKLVFLLITLFAATVINMESYNAELQATTGVTGGG